MRLIDADALTELIATNVYPICDAFNSRDYGMFWTGGIEKAINSAPTIDAVSVVRCKDCKHMYRTIFAGSIYNNCGKRTEHVEPDGYCEQGER